MIAHSKPWITNSDREAIDRVVARGMIAQGDEVRRFEERCAEFLGINGCVVVGSGTAALTLALRALNLDRGCEVILPTYVCRDVLEAVLDADCAPSLCDVGEHWNMTVDTVKKVITPRTGAIILVHIYGIPIDVDAFLALGLPVVEDACQALGARLNGQPVGTFGHVGVYSFHATKCLTTGEGGLAASNESRLLDRMRTIRNGRTVDFRRVASPMSDIQAALGLSQLERYTQFLATRRTIADMYFKALRHCAVTLPDEVCIDSMYFRFPVRVRGDFEVFRRRFAEWNVEIRRGVDELLHWSFPHPARSFDEAERLFNETISLPIYPALTTAEQETVIAACCAILT